MSSLLGKVVIAKRYVDDREIPYVLDMKTGRTIITDERVIKAFDTALQKVARLETEIADLVGKNRGLLDELYGLQCEVSRLDRENGELRERLRVMAEEGHDELS
jgi:FtsZ-binding cell division protein ZapB